MFLTEFVPSEDDVRIIFETAINNPKYNGFREGIIDPIIAKLSTPEGRKKYVGYGDDFLAANSDMLAKEYPTKAVTFPKRYVDDIIALFGFTLSSLKEEVTKVAKSVNDSASFKTIINTPTNVIHTIALFYSDMIGNRLLRDSAKQQMGLTIYNLMFNKYFGSVYSESVMAYTYMNMSRTWGIVQSENLVSWIGNTVDTSYAFWKTSLSVNMSPNILLKFLNRVRTSFNQNMKHLKSEFTKNLQNGNLIGGDLDGSEDYVVTSNFTVVRQNLIRLIRTGDTIYSSEGELYKAISRLKNVKCCELFELAQKVDPKDIGTIMDAIFYVFINKEGNDMKDINSTLYISRITNMPTAIDRAIAGKPIILPLSKKYKVDSSIIKAYICLVATYIMQRIGDANNK